MRSNVVFFNKIKYILLNLNYKIISILKLYISCLLRR